MNNSQVRRLALVIVVLSAMTLVVITRLINYQIIEGPEWAARAIGAYDVTDEPERGIIYDRNGTVLAVDKQDYQVSVSPEQIMDPESLASELAPILQKPRSELIAMMSGNEKYRLLASRVSSEVADAIKAAGLSRQVALDPLPRRYYPQNELLCHVLGYVSLNGNPGGGVEGFYQPDLAGMEASGLASVSPIEGQDTVLAREGADIVLTIDRSVQYVVERHLREALVEHGAVSGEIVVMDPRTGAILAMASLPCYNPNDYIKAHEENPNILINPLVTKQHEPGSIMKLITMAAALDSGTVTPTSTYNDTGLLVVGAHKTVNWDRSAPGITDMTTLLSRSLNVGAATLAMQMGRERFYQYFERFGFGRQTGVDIMAEAQGMMILPGSSDWREELQATSSYGQGIAVTPVQMISAISALANDGMRMQPYVVAERRDSSGITVHEPKPISQPISAETAQLVTAMAVTAVSREVPEAQVAGYTIAGKTGTAQIFENGMYHPTDVIGSFVGWLPADDPEIAVMVKLDRPAYNPWGSKTAAPTFAKLVEELVVMLNIPPDNIRLQPDIIAARSANE